MALRDSVIAGYAETKITQRSGSDPYSLAGVIVDSGSFVVTKANLTSYDTERQQKTDQLKQDFDAKYLSCK